MRKQREHAFYNFKKRGQVEARSVLCYWAARELEINLIVDLSLLIEYLKWNM